MCGSWASPGSPGCLPLRGHKCVYFIRGDADRKPAVAVDVDKSSDAQVLFGEVSSTSPLANLADLLAKMFNPRFNAMSSGEWKRADASKQKEFLSSTYALQ